MTEPGILKTFESHQFLKDLSERHLMILASGVKPFTAAPGEYLAKEGATADAFYLIQSGHIELLAPNRERSDVPIQTVGPGEIIGWSWLVPPYKWAFDCRALDEVRGLAFDAEWLREKCEQDHELGYHLLRQLIRILASRLGATRFQLPDTYK